MSGRSILKVDGVSSLDYGIWVSGDDVLRASEPDIETVTVPGRNGDLIYSNKRFNNFQIQYPAFIRNGFITKFMQYRAFLYSDLGYRKIEDSYFPDMFRQGRVTGSLNPSDIVWNSDAGLFSITFDCKPQHYYKSGTEKQIIESGDLVKNPTYFKALPLIRVYGYGDVSFNDSTITIDSHNYTYIDLDCEAQDAFYGTINCNNLIELSDDSFPGIDKDGATITFDETVTRLELIPRWWTL